MGFFTDLTIAFNNALVTAGDDLGISVFLDGDPSGDDADNAFISAYTLSNTGIAADVGYNEEYSPLYQVNVSMPVADGEYGVNTVIDNLRGSFGIGKTAKHGSACFMIDGFDVSQLFTENGKLRKSITLTCSAYAARV